MPYTKDNLPDNIKKLDKKKQEQWIAVFNSAYAKAIKDKKSKEDAESAAFAKANGVVKIKEALDGGMRDFQDKIGEALKLKFGTDAWFRDVKDNYVYFETWNQTKDINEQYRTQYKIESGEFVFETPEEIEIKEIVTKKKESYKFSESRRLLEAKSVEGKEWEAVLIQVGKSKNKGPNGYPLYYSEEAIKEAVESGLFVKAPVTQYKYGFTDDHVPAQLQEWKPEGLAGNEIGWVNDVTFSEFTDKDGNKGQGAIGLVHIADGEKALRENLLDKWNAGRNIDFSIDGNGATYVTEINGEMVDYVSSISEILENTLVSHGAAGGTAIRLAASTNVNQGESDMKVSEIVALIKEHKPKLLDGKDVEKLTESDAMAILKEAMKPEVVEKEVEKVVEKVVEKEPETPVKESAEMKAIQDQFAKLQESFLVGQKAQTLNTRLAESKLPDEVKETIRERYTGKDYSEDELNKDLASQQKAWSKLQESTPQVGNQLVSMGSDKRDKVQLAVDGMFEGESLKDADGKVVPMFTSIKAAFAEVDGRPGAINANANIILNDSYFYMPKMDTSDRLTESYNAGRREALRESHTTSSWGEILGDSITRKMIKDFNADPWQDWRKVVSDIVPLNDFRTQRRQRMSGFGLLNSVSEQGTYQDLTDLTDEEVTYSPAKKGGLANFTLEMIANDDIGALRKIPVKLGRAASITLYRDIFNMFLNNLEQDGSTALASTGRANKLTSALRSASWAEMVYTMRSLTAYGDTYDTLGYANKPKILIVPNELEEMAGMLAQGDKVVNAVRDADTASNNYQHGTEPNLYKGLIEPIVVDYLTDADAWWAVADPKKAPTIEVGFMNGKQEPELFVQDQPNVGSMFTADKITYKIRFCYGYAIMDFRSFGASIPA